MKLEASRRPVSFYISLILGVLLVILILFNCWLLFTDRIVLHKQSSPEHLEVSVLCMLVWHSGTNPTNHFVCILSDVLLALLGVWRQLTEGHLLEGGWRSAWHWGSTLAVAEQPNWCISPGESSARSPMVFLWHTFYSWCHEFWFLNNV